MPKKKVRGFLRYDTYVFKDHDPVIDELETLADDSNVSINEACNRSRVSRSTVRNWFKRKTKRPQHATVQAYAGAHDMRYVLQKNKPGRK